MKPAIFRSLKINTTALTVVLALYFISALNFTMFTKLVDIIKSLGEIDYFFVLTVPFFFLSAFTIIFTPFVIKYITKPFFIFLILISSIANYASFQFGIIFNDDMMRNILETTPAEAGSYLNLKFIIWFTLTGLVPALLLGMTTIVYQSWKKEIGKKLVLILVCAGVIGSIGALYYKNYASVARNNPKMQKDIIPIYPVSSTIKYLKQRFFVANMTYNQIGIGAKRLPVIEKENYLIVFIVGETARAQNYQLNGYPRATNAYTSDIDNLFYFKNATSCGTATAVSLPCMFSLLGKKNYTLDKANHQDNVIDIILRGKGNAVWIDNNTGCKGVCHDIKAFQTTQIPELKCVGEECTDDVMLKVMDEKIKSFNGQEGIVFLHLMGSHGPTYYKRYPKDHAKFQPDCKTSDLQSCTDEEIVNSYDNTILFTDYVISKVIDNLQSYDKTYHTALFYMSDHGESLGENGIYLHGMPYNIAPAEQTHVPFMMWMSDKMMKHKTIDPKCLHDYAGKGTFSHDNLSHTLLRLMDVETKLYDQSQDVLRGCQERHE